MHTSLQSMPGGNEPRNFVAHLGALARERGEATWLTVIGERDGQPAHKTVSYAALDRRVRALAATLQQQGLVGERALLMLDNDDHYVVALLACFYAGVIAVPVFPPRAARTQHLERLASIAADAKARCVLAVSSHSTAAAPFAALTHIDVDAIDPALCDAWIAHSPADSDVAFLQYTSGSTSAPKGVMVTHGNLLANERALQSMLDLGPQDTCVSWQPLYHDMGLIGGLLLPLYNGGPLVLTSPEYFLERPSRWLELISCYRAAASAGPDFAYRLCIDRIKDSQLAQFDLSSWRMALTGAEPIRSDTVRLFCEKFAAAGFDARAMRASYGLAEATLIATAGRTGGGLHTATFCSDALTRHVAEPCAEGSTLVSSGVIAPEHGIRIVDPARVDAGHDAPLPDGRIGEIWLTGPSITAGYWAHPQTTAATFVVADGARWLRTGDLGFLHAGELFVTGRRKDLIVVRGHNIYPQDVEQAIERAVAAVRKGRVAAFAVERRDVASLDGAGAEGIGIAVEIARSERKRMAPHALADALAAAVSEACGEPLSVIALLEPGALPRTSSGKLQRAACRKGWNERTLDAYALFEHGRMIHGEVGEAAAVEGLNGTQRDLAAIWRDVLRWDAAFSATPATHFFASGGNSLAAVAAARSIADRWDIEFTAGMLFEQPRLAAAAQAIDSLRAAGAHRVASSIPVLPHRSGPLPLSHAQQRQWFLWQLDPHRSAYHVNVVLRLRGTLHVEILRAALQEVGARHESLRTVFNLDAAGNVSQHVQSQCRCTLDEIELGESQALQEIAQRNRQPFDLTCGPLLRVTLARVGAQQHLLALSMHHIVSDAGSMQVLITELMQRYEGLCNGIRLPAAPPPIQYADYAVWLRERLVGGVGERQLAYWRAHLAVPEAQQYPVLSLATDHPRKALARYRAGSHDLLLPAALTQRLQQCAREQGATLFMTLLAGFAALLHRYTGQHDLRIGVPVANRQRPEIAQLIGLCVNTLVFRLEVPSRVTLQQLLARVRDTASGAQSHPDLPFESLVEVLQPQRSLSSNPLFQVMFNHLQEDESTLPLTTELAIGVVPMGDADAQFELALDVRERADSTLRAVFTYAAELFEPRTIARMAEHYQALLTSIATDVGQVLAEVQYLSQPELAQISRGFAMPSVSRATSVHGLIEERARLQPDNVALLWEGEAITYRTLDRWANHLAQQLIELGVRAESRVAVALERAPMMVAALLGCLKAGGVYVPLNPADPTPRRIEILIDSRSQVVMTQGPVPGDLPVGVRTLRVDQLPIENIAAPHVPLHPAHLAYLIYTSGTTGRPKAVAVGHGALSAHVQAMIDTCSMTAADRVLLFAPVQVDAALEQTLVPLAAGGAVVLQRHWSSLAVELEAVCARHAVTVLDLPPAYARQLLQEAASFDAPLRLVMCGGEAWTATDLELMRRVLRPRQLINAYGPTEAVITPTLQVLDGNTATAEQFAQYVPIGRPVGQRRAYVLDQQLQPVAEGLPGELYLGGEDALARGYLERAALTAERFIADPFVAGGRLYRTGDLVRWCSDASGGVQLEYLERIDAQVKLHGFRIEPGEVEARLRCQPQVREAVVIATQARSSVLIAYVTPAQGESLDGATLRRQLQEELPDYMVPAAVVVLARLPLNDAGKIDRRALPVPVFDAARPAHVAPRGEVALTLAALWSEVLGLERVGLYDNFFDLGGNSLLLIRVHRLLEERLHAGLTITDLFRLPTIDALARHIESAALAAATLDASQLNTSQLNAASRDRAALKHSALQRRRAHATRMQ